MWPFKRKPQHWLVMLWHRNGVVYCYNRHPSSGGSWGDFSKWTMVYPTKASAEAAMQDTPYMVHGVSLSAERADRMPASIRERLPL